MDILWQLTSKFRFNAPLHIDIESKYSNDKFLYDFGKVLALASTCFSPNTVPDRMHMVCGIFVRVAVSVVRHWTITYFCHNPGSGRWRGKNAAVQASNIPGLGLITYGECWHNNHHAFPESAKIGFEKVQSDTTWRFIQILNALGLVGK
ncbi:MAG: fatty-acid desaturase [Polaribacter sp.]|jgi:fatty-acid desaturase